MNNLKKARKAKGYTQVYVAKYIGLAQSSYSAWENGDTKIDPQQLVRLAKLYGTTVEYLIGDDAQAPGSLKIPVLGSVPAGIPLEAIEDVVDWEEIPQSMVNGDKEFFALQVKGDSMYPDYLPGDIVIVRKTPCCESGEDCVVYVNGYDATLKQVKISDEGITLLPRNPEYPPRTFTRDEVNSLPVTIAGVVVELRRKVGKGK